MKMNNYKMNNHKMIKLMKYLRLLVKMGYFQKIFFNKIKK